MKIKSLLTAAAVALAFASCDNDNTNEYHSTYFFPMQNLGIETYADQTVDSVRVISFDSWTLTHDCDWYQVSSNGKQAPLSIRVPAGYQSSDRLDFQIQPNTTGKVRNDLVEVVSSFDKIGTVAQMLIQYPYLNILNPRTTDKTNYDFTMIVSGAGTTSSSSKPNVSFIVYSEDATLSSNVSWLTPDKTEGFAKDNKQNVSLTIEKNETEQTREAVLTLTSNGVSTPIHIKQPVYEKQPK